jgi:phosphatidylglycerol:prolipoprotein diacylglycerol transferase
MRQVLFRIPLKPFDWLPDWWPENVPLFGFGTMLCVTLIVTTWMASRRARRAGIAPQHVQDLAIWIFVFGVLGARVVYMFQYGVPLSDFLKFWEGGLVFYGSAVGGVIGYAAAYWLVIRRHGLSTWKLADVIAPCVAVGLLLGRFGCLLNGCCFGNVCLAEWRAVHYPLSAPPRFHLVREGLQTAAGFAVGGRSDREGCPVGAVAAGSPAAEHGLRPGDLIVRANDRPIRSVQDLDLYLGYGDGWPRGLNDLSLAVLRDDRAAPLELPAVSPRTLGLHPTQLYESISMALLLLVLLSVEAFQRPPGVLMVLFMLGYSAHRFLNEMLRDDTDPIRIGGWDTHMTLSQNGSILFFAAGLLLLVWRWRTPAEVAGSKSAS